MAVSDDVKDQILPEVVDYRQLGFYAVLTEKDTGTDLEKLLEKERDKWQREEETFEEYYAHKIELIKERIEACEIELEGLRLDLLKHKEDTEELLKRKKILVEKVEKINAEVSECYEQLSSEQSKLVQKRIDDSKEELLSLIQGMDEVFDKKFGGENEMEVRYKSSLDLLKALQERYKSIYEKVRIEADKLLSKGMGFFSIQFLLGVGAAVATTSGIFFANFSQQTGLESKQLPVEFLSRFFMASESFFKLFPQNRLVGGLMIFGVLLAFLVLASFLIWFGQTQITRFTDDKADYKLGKSFSGANSKFIANITSQTIFSLWLHSLPFIFLLGTFFIVVCIGSAPDDFPQMAKYMAAQSVGSTLSLMAGGILFLYITKIIETRNEKKEDGSRSRMRLTELAIAALIFLLFSLVLIFGVSYFTHLSRSSKAIQSLLGFFTSSAVAGIVIGYGFRHLNILVSAEQVETMRWRLTGLIALHSGKRPLVIWNDDGVEFKKRFVGIQKELYSLIEGKLSLSNYLRKPKTPSASSKGLTQFLRKLFGVQEPEVQELNNFQIANFPDKKTIIDSKNTQLKNITTELKKVDDDIDEKREGKTALAKGLIEQIEKEEKKHEEDQQELVKAQWELTEGKKQLENQRRNREKGIKDGYLLGKWYESNGPETN